jgi:hypothetical protein
MATDNNPLNKLQDIAQQGRLTNSFTPEETIVYGNRMKNKFIRDIVEKKQQEGKFDDKTIIAMVLAIDEMIEKGELTEENLKLFNDN